MTSTDSLSHFREREEYFMLVRRMRGRFSHAAVGANPTTLQRWNLGPGSQISVCSGETIVRAWLYGRQDVAENEVELSTRVRRRLGVDAGATIRVVVPRRAQLIVVPALIDRLPPADIVEVRENVCDYMGHHRWALLSHQGLTMPVRLRPARIRDGEIRMSMLARSLVGFTSEPGANATVQLSELPAESHRSPILGVRTLVSEREWHGWIGLPIFIARSTIQCFESLARLFLKAPKLCVRTTEALVGDDTNRVVRLASHVFPLLGLHPGDHVVVQWARRRTLAVALEKPDYGATPRNLPRHVDPEMQGIPENIPAEYLTIGIAAEMRSALGIPRHTVVTIQRRVVPLVSRRLNELTIPVGGLLLAAATVKGLSRTAVAIGLVVIILLAMLPARHKTPPSGRWP
jgi:hypothetical protein